MRKRNMTNSQSSSPRAPEAKCDALIALMRESTRALAFTGAGISTDSGIPDFRSPTGLWKTFAPIPFQEFMASAETRREAWRRKFEMEKNIGAARPNDGHKALAQLVRQGKLQAVITQNIDNLHQDSGIPEAQVIELHGNGSYALCLACGLRHALAHIRKTFAQSGEPPTCRDCGGIVKTGTISFGQPMPDAAMRRAEEAARACDLFLAIGSSLQVFPAAGFPLMAKQHGAKLVILNREPTEMDGFADLVLHESISPVLVQLGESCSS